MTYTYIDDVMATERTYYEYRDVSLGSFVVHQYIGTPTVKKIEDEPPANSTRMQPPTVPDGMCCYWDASQERWYWSPDLTTLKDSDINSGLCAAADQTFAATMKDLNAGYTDAERATWDQQLSEAQRVLAGGTSSFLEAMLLDGEKVEDLAKTIVAKATAYQAKVGAALLALRQARAAAATTTLDEVLKQCESVSQLTAYALRAKK